MFLIVPIQQDKFAHQAIKYLFEELSELDVDDLKIHLVFGQFEKPGTVNQEAFSNLATNIFLEDELFKDFVNTKGSTRICPVLRLRDMVKHSGAYREREELLDFVQQDTSIMSKRHTIHKIRHSKLSCHSQKQILI